MVLFEILKVNDLGVGSIAALVGFPQEMIAVTTEATSLYSIDVDEDFVGGTRTRIGPAAPAPIPLFTRSNSHLSSKSIWKLRVAALGRPIETVVLRESEAGPVREANFADAWRGFHTEIVRRTLP